METSTGVAIDQRKNWEGEGILEEHKTMWYEFLDIYPQDK